MSNDRSRYHRHRFPPEIASRAVWVCHRSCVSLGDVEDVLAERGVIVSHEATRYWRVKFGPTCAATLRHRQGRLCDAWFLDEVFVARGEFGGRL